MKKFLNKNCKYYLYYCLIINKYYFTKYYFIILFDYK